MKKSRIFACMLSVIMILSLMGAGSAAAVEYPRFLVVGGGSTGGLFFSVAAGFAQLFSTKTPIQATAQTTTGGGQNILLMAGGEMEMAIADNEIIQQAFNGANTFEGKKNDNIRAIGGVYPTYFQQIVRPEAGITTMSDLGGKRMVVGGPSSGTENATRIVYEAHGYQYQNNEDMQAEWLGVAAGQEAVQNDQADGMTSISLYPYSVYTEMSMIDAGRVISLNEDAIEKLCSGNSPYIRGTIPAGTYKGQDEDVHTIVMKTLLITKGDLPEDLVYELTKLIYENKEYLISQNNAFEHLDVNTAWQGLTIPLHPGAEKYYREVGAMK